jgi:glycosyltransferase involved in cell wall biosynthesis
MIAKARQAAAPASASLQQTPADDRESRRLSVLAVTPIFENGGTEVQLLELGHALRARGDRYRVVTGGGTRVDDLRQAGIDHRIVRQTAGLVPVPVELSSYSWAIVRELLAEPVDVIQSTSIRSTYAATAAIAAYALWRPRAPEPAVVTTLHGGKQHDLYGRAARHLRWMTDAVITVAQEGRDALLRRGFPADRVRVVPPGRDLSAFLAVAAGATAPAELAGVPAGARVVLAVGRLAPLKGIEYLLDAWVSVVAAAPDAVLVIVGSGELEAELRARATTLAIAGSVVFAGFRTDVPALLARAHAFVLSSLWEGLPMSVVEAMAAHRPVVATAAGGTSDVVRDGDTGLLVPPRDAAALADALRRVLADQQLAARLADAGSQQVLQRYTREALLAATRAVYLQACERRASRSNAWLAYEA